MLVRRWPEISSDFICIYEKSLVVVAPPQTPLGELMMLPQTPKSAPDDLRHNAPVALAPYYLRIQHSSWIEVPKLWSP